LETVDLCVATIATRAPSKALCILAADVARQWCVRSPSLIK